MKESEIEAYLVWHVEVMGGKAYKFKSPSQRGVTDRKNEMKEKNMPPSQEAAMRQALTAFETLWWDRVYVGSRDAHFVVLQELSYPLRKAAKKRQAKDQEASKEKNAGK